MARQALRTTQTLTGRFSVLLCMILLILLFAPSVAFADQAPQSTDKAQVNQISQVTERADQVNAVQTAEDIAPAQEPQKTKADLASQEANQAADAKASVTSDDPAVTVKKAANVKAASDTQPIAFAVYDETTDTLSYHKQMSVPEEGSTFVGSDNVKRTVSKLYMDIENVAYASVGTSPGWSSKNAPGYGSSQIIFVDVISPISTYKWFGGQSLVTSLDLNKLDTSNTTNMWSMFDGCSALTSLDLTPLNTSNVTDMRGMFRGCSSLTELDFSNFDTRNVTMMNSMFIDCSSMKGFDLRSFDTSKVTAMTSMFMGCSSAVVIDLSSFDIRTLTLSPSNMFNGCSSLTTIYAGENWVPSEKVLRDGVLVFKDCLSLVGSHGSMIDLNDNDKYKAKYLKIDGGPDDPDKKGYLSTRKKSLTAVTVTGLDMRSVLCTDTVGPTPTVMDGDKLLAMGVHYQTEFTQRSDKKNACITIIGIGEYEGFIRKEFATMYILTKQPSDTRIIWSRDRLDEAIEQTEKNAPIVLKSNSRFADFVRLLLNGKVVGPEHYTVTEGSTIIEINPEYLNSLRNGTYVVEIVSQDDTVAAEITIEGDNEPVDPDPGTDPDDPDPVDPDPVVPDPTPENPAPVTPNPVESGDSSGSAGSGTSTVAPPASSSAESGSGTVASAPINEAPSAAPAKTYGFLEGDNGAHEIGSGKGLTVRVDGDLEKFLAVLIDDEELDARHYTTKAGSTIVTIDPEHLDTLPEGDHKLTVRFSDGEATTSFAVHQGPEAEVEPLATTANKTLVKQPADSRGDVPDTGDADMAALLLLMLACVLGFCGIRRSTSL